MGDRTSHPLEEELCSPTRAAGASEDTMEVRLLLYWLTRRWPKVDLLVVDWKDWELNWWSYPMVKYKSGRGNVRSM